MAKMKQQQPPSKQKQASASATTSASATSASNKASDAAPGATGGKRQQQPQQPQPPYLALLNAGGAETEGGTAAVEKALGALDALTEEPEAFVAPPPELAQALTRVLKAVFDHARSTQPIKLGPLQELLVEGFDTETLWEQLQLRNPAVAKFVQRVIRRLEEQGDGLAVLDESEEESGEEREEGEGSFGGEEDRGGEGEGSESEGSDEGSEDGGEEEEDQEEEEEEEEEPQPPKAKKAQGGKKQQRAATMADGDEESEEGAEGEGGKAGPSKLNDGFFDWDEMERFADEAEQEEFGDDEEESDDDEDDEDEEDEEGMDLDDDGEGNGGREIRYKDFFGDGNDEGDEGDEGDGDEEGEGKGEAPFDHEEEEEEEQEAEEEESEVDEGALTAYERMKRAKRKEIQALEEELVAERPWELRGEVKASERPENSLLEAVVDVERARRPEPLEAPAETSQSLEEMIKQRILEERFDDVVPREAGGEAALLNRRGRREELPEVSQEKSKEGLGEVYEKEYMRLALGVEGESAEAKEKAEMAALFRRLCTKLDALSNFHFTPKAVKVDVSVRANVPAIAMEEVLPLAVSAGDTQAPEEVHEKKKGRAGVLRDPAELAQEERKRIRQGKKAARRKARRQKQAEEKLVARLNPGLGNKYAREKVRAEIRESGKVVQGTREGKGAAAAYSTSSKFFSALQEEVTKHGGGYAKKKAGGEAEGRLGAANALKL